MRFTKGQTPWNKGVRGLTHKPCSEETKAKIAVANSKPKVLKICPCGQPFEVWPSKMNRAKYCSRKCHDEGKVGRPAWNKGKKGYMSGEAHHWHGRDVSGAKNPSWKGGPAHWKKSGRRWDSGYIGWVFLVRERDGNRCRIDNGDCSGVLEVHHILPWRNYPELRYEVNNGITLCHFHHPRKASEEAKMVPQLQYLVDKTTIL